VLGIGGQKIVRRCGSLGHGSAR